MSKHKVILDCGKKTVVLRCSGQSEVIIQGIRSSAMSNVILAMQARRFLRKGCETFFSLILDSKRGQVDVEKISVVREFPDCTRNNPISRAPYRMAPSELKEFRL